MQPKTPKRRAAMRRANRPMPRRRIDLPVEAIDYKNPELLRRFVTETGKILPRRLTGVPAHLHRRITRAIKAAWNPARVGLIVAGFEVPHAHLHLIPADEMADLSFAHARASSAEELAAAATTLRAALRAQGEAAADW